MTQPVTYQIKLTREAQSYGLHWRASVYDAPFAPAEGQPLVPLWSGVFETEEEATARARAWCRFDREARASEAVWIRE